MTLLPLAMVGCDAGPGAEVFDRGQVCITSAAADAPLTVQVTLDECVGACIRNEVETCEIVRDGNTLRLSSEFSYDEAPDDEVCIALCNAQQATCSSEPLPAGQYVLEHGDDSYPVALPASGLPQCL